MNILFFPKKHLRTKILFKIAIFTACLLLTLIGCTACTKQINYFDYVSELRNNILVAKSESFSLRIYAVCKESPYSTDGIPRETFSRMEAYLSTPEGNKETQIQLQIDDKHYEGEMSYDLVKGAYYYSCPADVSSQREIVCLVRYGEEELELTATSILTKDTISPQEALQKLQTEKAELFSSMTDKYGFSGEIYLRLLFEDSPYYYVGIIDRQGNCIAFLMNAETGKILAQRQTQT
jgi:hypothetical protein